MQSGLCGDELFGLRGELGEVGGQRRIVDPRVCERLARASAGCDFAGELPIDSGRHVVPNYCCFFG